MRRTWCFAPKCLASNLAIAVCSSLQCAGGPGLRLSSVSSIGGEWLVTSVRSSLPDACQQSAVKHCHQAQTIRPRQLCGREQPRTRARARARADFKVETCSSARLIHSSAKKAKTTTPNGKRPRAIVMSESHAMHPSHSPLCWRPKSNQQPWLGRVARVGDWAVSSRQGVLVGRLPQQPRVYPGRPQTGPPPPATGLLLRLLSSPVGQPGQRPVTAGRPVGQDSGQSVSHRRPFSRPFHGLQLLHDASSQVP